MVETRNVSSISVGKSQGKKPHEIWVYRSKWQDAAVTHIEVLNWI
jgi:hypothetical protein